VTAVEVIGELFAGPGARDYLGEPVTIGEHMLQAAALAEAAGAAGPLVAAALLHDIGHVLGEPGDGTALGVRGGEAHQEESIVPRADTDTWHGEAGARWLSQWFGEAVTAPVRLHVAAKRYLCAVDSGYFGLLSAESVRTLSLQGGPMTAAEAAAFEALPHAREAATVRRWDDQAKDPAATPPRFAHFAPLLATLVRS
jgi:gamma-butyrobetaine dioxygenase